jgi:hypothetical protein
VDPRAIDPTECWLRHVRRGSSGDVSARALGRVWFVREEAASGRDGINGRQGWQSCDVALVLSDDSTFKLTLPNAAGDDGVLHRRRFAVLTDPDYEPGEEWIEVWSNTDPENPLLVGTPCTYNKTKSTVTISGVDLTVVLAGAMSSDTDLWDAAAPGDVIRHYTRLPVVAYGSADLTAALDAAASGTSTFTQALTGIAADSWEVETRVLLTTPAATAAGQYTAKLLVQHPSGPQPILTVDLYDGSVTFNTSDANDVTVKGRNAAAKTPGEISLRILARYDHLFAFVDGEMVADVRRQSWAVAPSGAQVSAIAGAGAPAHLIGTVTGLHAETLFAFAARAAAPLISRALPGALPPTGLRAQYWNAAAVYSQETTALRRLERLWSMLREPDPVVDRIEPKIDYAAASGDVPPGSLPGAFTARWTGAIYLDLAAADRKVKFTAGAGSARIYIGRTLRGDEAAQAWWGHTVTTAVSLTTPALRSWLGTSEAGWYPVVIEFTRETNTGQPAIKLEDTALDGTGAEIAYGTVPTSRLSYLGIYADLVRLEAHRTVIDEVAKAFGLQWRVQPRSMESGEFPGQLEVSPLLGRQTAVTIDDDAIGTDAEVSGSATDVVDGILADGAGIANPDGSGQLTARAVDYPRALDHLSLRQVYESLSEISEPALLATRVESLLLLRSSPNEEVGVRPQGQRDLVDTFPLTGVLARMDWRPADAPLLNLDSLDVVDSSPRQMTSVAWTARPDGLGVPTVGFRQRPRSVSATLRRMTRAIYGARRYYQGSVALSTGSPGSTDPGQAPDGYTRVPLPTNMDDVVRAVLVVRLLTGVAWRMEINDVDLGTPAAAISALGRYDVTAHVAQQQPGRPQMKARLIGGAGGDTYAVTLELTIRV